MAERNAGQLAERYVASRRARPAVWLVADLLFGAAVAACVWAAFGKTAAVLFVVAYAASVLVALIARRAHR